MRELIIVNDHPTLRNSRQHFEDNETGKILRCAFGENRENCTPDCVACGITNNCHTATCLRGSFDFGTVVDTLTFHKEDVD